MSRVVAKTELPRYVGYAEIAEATGIEKHTIQRLMKAGKFPKPDALPTKGNRWRLSVVTAWLEQRNAEQIAALSDSAVTDPAKLKPEQLADTLQILGARLASLHGDQVAPEDIVGVTRRLTPDEERMVLQRNADAQREMIEGVLQRLDGLHVVEALILQRAYLAPLARHADDLLKHFGLDISLTPDEWRQAGWLIAQRVFNGEAFAPETHPRDAAESLATDGVLSRR